MDRSRTFLTRLVSGALGLLLLLQPGPLLATKTDVVQLMNGDEVTGEIKLLERGKLTYKTDSMGTLNVEWDEVRRVRSLQYLEFEHRDGYRMYGTLVTATKLDTLAIQYGEQVSYVPIQDITHIRPIKKSFWDRFDGSLSVGFSFTRASNVAQFSFNSRTKYSVERNELQLNFQAIVTTQTDDEVTRTGDGTLIYTRLLPGRWFTAGSVGVSRNDELGLIRRVQTSAIGGYRFVTTNQVVLGAGTGLQVNDEKNQNVEGTTQNLEGVFALSFQWFRYNTPKTDLSTTLNTYPNLAPGGRFRLNYDLNWKHELFTDFYGDISFYTKYDSRPPSTEASNTDYGIVFSLSWSY